MASAAADPRWLVLARDGEEAVRNLALAVRTWDDRARLGSPGGDLPLILEKAVQKALQDGYASFGLAAEAVLDFAGEPKRRDAIGTSTSSRWSCRPPCGAPPWRRAWRTRSTSCAASTTSPCAPVRDSTWNAPPPAIAAAQRVAAELPAAFEEFGRAFSLLPSA